MNTQPLRQVLLSSLVIAVSACAGDGCDCSGEVGSQAEGSGSGAAAAEASGAAAPRAEKEPEKPPEVIPGTVGPGFDPERTRGLVLGPDWAERAYAVYEQECRAGDSAACVRQGAALHDGIGVAQSWDRAREMFTANCEAGAFEACLKLRDMYRFGNGIPVDPSQADALLDKVVTDGSAACKSGVSARACVAAANAVREKGGPAAPAAEVQQLLELGCKGGAQRACLDLGSAMVQLPDELIAVGGLRYLSGAC
jgi:hypothetical protein